jgi:hypothetical protein
MTHRRRLIATVALLSALTPACAQPDDCAEASRFASEVLALEYGPGQNFGRNSMPEVVFGPPRGAGCCSGSTDVVSLGNGGSITLGFSGNAIVDGPGADFVVFENAFETAAGGAFVELASVEVSDDGDSWYPFGCASMEAPYDSCAGVSPVYSLDDPGPIDPETSGGDSFDLADVGIARARFVRITDRADQTGLAGVFDLDAVGIVHSECP